MSSPNGSFTDEELRDAFMEGAVLLDRAVDQRGDTDLSPIELGLNTIRAVMQRVAKLTADPEIREGLERHVVILRQLELEVGLVRLEGWRAARERAGLPD
jgi:hypothetical protein